LGLGGGGQEGGSARLYRWKWGGKQGKKMRVNGCGNFFL
jgi:hypothetical protein